MTTNVKQVSQADLEAGYTDDDMVAEWVGTHYGRNFDKMNEEDRAAYRDRFTEMHNSCVS